MPKNAAHFADGDWIGLRRVINKIAYNTLGINSTPQFAGLTLSDLSASRLVWSDANDTLASKDLIDLVAGTTNRVTVTDDTNGGIVINGPQDIHTGASPQFTGLGIGVAPNANYDIYTEVTHTGPTLPQIGAFIAMKQSAANSSSIYGCGSQAESTHTSGTMSAMYGYVGGAVLSSNGAATTAVGVKGTLLVTGANTPSITVAVGMEAGVTLAGASATFAISGFFAAPTVGAGSMTEAISVYAAEPTGGIHNYAGLFLGDVVIASDKKLVLEGALGTIGDTYFVYDSGATTLDCFVNATECLNMGSTGVEAMNKCKLTSIGGYAVKLTNKTGGVTTAGALVKADTANDDAVIYTAINDVECIGVFLDSGVADGAETWVVVAGIADVVFDENTAAASGDWVATGATAGLARAQASPAAAPTHFEEIGHCIETNAAGGVGTYQISRCVLHFN